MKKRWLGILLALCLLVCLAPAALATETEPSVGLAEVYVSADGNDTNGDGSEGNPVASLAKAVDLASKDTDATIYVMSDLEMTQTARYWDNKDITITSHAESLPEGKTAFTISRSTTEPLIAVQDDARGGYNPALIEVGNGANLTLINIVLDDQGIGAYTYNDERNTPYFNQVDASRGGNPEGEPQPGSTTINREEVDNHKIVQDAIIASYDSNSIITLGNGAVLQNYGGMSAVRVTGSSKLVMSSGSIITDTLDISRNKGDGGTGPAGAVWLQNGNFEMNDEAEITKVNGRAVYMDIQSSATMKGTISNITSNKSMWEGENGVGVYIRDQSTVEFSGIVSSCSGGSLFFVNRGNLHLTETSSIGNSTSMGIAPNEEVPEELSQEEILKYNNVRIDGEITGINGGATGNKNPVQFKYGTLTVGSTAKIHDNRVNYGALYLQRNAVVHIYGKIYNNTADGRGGAVGLAGHGFVEIHMYDGAEMTNNTAARGGGAISLENAILTMHGGTITGNRTNEAGGAIHLRGNASFIMESGLIANNQSESAGGGIAFSATTNTDTVKLLGGTISQNQMNSSIQNDLAILSSGFSSISRYLTVSEDMTLGNPDVYMQKYGFTLLDPQRGTKLGNASTDGETALKEASTEKGWSNTLLASFWAQADKNQTWVLSGLEKAADKEKLPVYALVMPTNAEGNVGTNTKAAVYAVTVNADGTWSFTVPDGNTNGYVVGLVQPTTNYGTLTLVADPATLTEGVGGTVNYTATYTPADNLINQLDDKDAFTLTITLAPDMTYVEGSGSGLTYNEGTHTLTMQVSANKLQSNITVSFSATAPDTIKAGDTFVTNAVLEGTITVEGNEVPVTLVANATVEVTPKPEDPIEPTDPPYIPPVDPDEPADPDDTGVSDLLNTEDHIQYLFGYPDGTFGPENNMTRAEVAQMFYNLLLDQDVEITKTFDDVPANAWYTKAVNTLASLDIISGVGDNKFEPERSITRAEFTAMAMKFAVGGEEGENIFSDVDENDWFYDAVVNSIQYGWIHGYGDGTFRPNNPITRAEVTAIVNNMLGRAADEDFVDEHTDELTPFSDIEKHWAYYHIVEATNDHDYTKPSSGENWTKLN